ncbi:MAG: cytochrome P450 [Gemmatimonadetes bacterium]|nr:cytochrome P450 [Gemmatimonadota bacterium]
MVPALSSPNIALLPRHDLLSPVPFRWRRDPDAGDLGRSGAAVATRPRFAFYPFGGGARQCIGEPVALQPSIVLEPRGELPIRLIR